MKFICNKTELSEAISNVSKAVSSKATIPALEGIKVKVSPNEIELTGYNLEMGIHTSISSITEDSGEFVVSSRLFSEFTKRMPEDEVTFEVNDNLIINISCSLTECSFSAMSAEEYPDLPVVDSDNSFKVKNSVLKSMINQTIYATSLNESKPILTGELFDINNGSFNMVAIDGFRLAIRCETIFNKTNYQFVVPRKALLEVSSLIKDDNEKECTIYTNDRHIIFETGKAFIISRLLEGKFHNYKSSIPAEHKTEVIINKRDFITSLERCSLLIDEKNKTPIRCEVGNGTVKLNCKTSIGKINDSLLANVIGEEITIGFNHKLMADAIRASEGDKVRIRFNGAMKVIEILPLEGNSFIFLVMPVQIKK
ncbi:MAG: DNA polymerase III subunit beta [Ruminococcus sp.]|nr:DNA polymerase III subunit beta [Ruminococcus sp.]